MFYKYSFIGSMYLLLNVGKISKTFVLLRVALFIIPLILLPSSTVKAQSKTIIVPDDFLSIATAIEQTIHTMAMKLQTICGGRRGGFSCAGGVGLGLNL